MRLEGNMIAEINYKKETTDSWSQRDREYKIIGSNEGTKKRDTCQTKLISGTYMSIYK